MTDPYQELATALADDGILCQFQTAGQMVVSGQVGPIWPNRGNSFWVTYTGGRCYLFTWAPTGYHVPETVNVANLCQTCMSVGDSAMFKVPDEIVQEFGLVMLTRQEAKNVYHEMDNAG
jgi:hypothetical protein